MTNGWIIIWCRPRPDLSAPDMQPMAVEALMSTKRKLGPNNSEAYNTFMRKEANNIVAVATKSRHKEVAAEYLLRNGAVVHVLRKGKATGERVLLDALKKSGGGNSSMMVSTFGWGFPCPPPPPRGSEFFDLAGDLEGMSDHFNSVMMRNALAQGAKIKVG